MRIVWIALALVISGAAGVFGFIYWPRQMRITLPSGMPEVLAEDSAPVISFPNRALVGQLAKFDDDLFAYLMFDHYRSLGVLSDKQVMLTSREQNGRPVYYILLRLPNDTLEGAALLENLQASGLTAALDYNWVAESEMVRDLKQTRLFLDAYAGPVNQSLDDLHPDELKNYLRRFIRFKSMTDPRVRSGEGLVPSPLTRTQATRLAADIIAVSKFYDIPIDLFLGVGAMENDYMNVPGDLDHAIWKRRPDPGDIVLERKRRRVLVVDYASGVWQITRHSLRYAHSLYLHDKRDYSELPERLRPPKRLDVNDVAPETLTTYAGLLLRDLLDRFQGDVAKAVGAYNGGVRNPNLKYAAGVEIVASYARRVIARAAALNRVAVSTVQFEDETDGEKE